jgi:predicted aspartyl protease
MVSFHNISRRAVLASLAVSPFASARAADSLNKTSPAAGATHLLAINVQIAGNGPYRFVVDTGADRTVIAQDVADALKLPRGPQAAVAGIARTVVADTVHVAKLDIDNLSKDDLDIPVLPRDWLGADGYLGLDVIDGHCVTFDFRNRSLTLGAPFPGYLPVRTRPDESVLRADGAHGRLRSFNCEVDGVRAVAFLDTGADVSVGNTRLLEALDGRFASTDTVLLTGVTGGSVSARTIAVDKLRLGGFDVVTAKLAVADLPIFELWGLKETPALFVGMDFLSHFSSISIDYGRKFYRLELASLLLAQRS